jgi:hypothetical protein
VEIASRASSPPLNTLVQLNGCGSPIRGRTASGNERKGL